jgi:hypothetical protein
MHPMMVLFGQTKTLGHSDAERSFLDTHIFGVMELKERRGGGIRIVLIP